MRFGVPWRSKGIRPEARETAQEAARRAGMSLDDWLNSVIMQQATQAGVPAYGAQLMQPTQPSDPRALAAVNHRLDDLNRRIEQFTRTGPAAYAPQRQPQPHRPDPRADLIGRLDQYVQNAQPPAARAMPQPAAMAGRRAPAQPNVPVLDQALADIAARQQMLNGGAPMPPRRPAPASPAAYAPPAARAQQAAAPMPTQDLSGLEDQLRKITDQIETLRYPGVEEAINALRAELGEIGHALGEAMPRQAIDTIERQIQGLSQRVAEGRQAGVDQGALAGIEHGLSEVRDALQGLTPAENLVGFNEAVAGLAHKIDLIVAEKDPETLAQLENAITTLRDMANHVASNDTVSALAAEVQALTDKVDYLAQAGANADALSSLEQRIDALGQALAERAQSGGAVPPRLEALVQSLSDKIEQIQAVQQTYGGEMAVGPLDDRISMLVQRLDASDSRIGQLEAIERGLSDLLLHVEQQQAARDPATANDAMAVDALKYDFAQAQESIKGDIARTQDALDQVHGTLGELVHRLATIEQNIRSDARAHPDFHEPAPAYPQFHDEEPLPLDQPVGKLGVRLVENDAPRLRAVEDAGPGMSAFDGMLSERSIQPDEPAPIAYEPNEPEPIADEQHEPTPITHQPVEPDLMHPAPPIQPEPDGIMDLEYAAMVEPEQGSLPPAPQLEVTYEALRAHAAAQAAQEQAPEAAAPQVEPPQDWAPDVPTPKRIPPSHGPINPDLPPDEPLEPGSGPPPLRANPGARIAASEAALGRGRSGADAPAGGKTSFIAAARRAAQAAMQLEPAKAPPAAEHESEPEFEETGTDPLRKRMMRRVKSLFVAAGIIVIVVGAVQIAATVLNSGKPTAPTTQTTKPKHLSMDRRADTVPTTTAQLPPRIAATPLALTPPGASIDLFALPGPTVQIAAVPTPDPRRTEPDSTAATDVTGSIPAAAANHSAPAPDVPASDLPVGIGSQRLRQAAAAGEGAAAYEVAMRFAEGRGVSANLTQAARWYERAANKGLAPAQFRLASFLEKGHGVKKDLGRARALYFSAARQGNAKAMHNLAVLYAEGIDGKPDYTTAVQWFRDAARHGVFDSQYNLGILYARGIGVEKSLPESYKWFALAAKQGDKEAARKRDEVARHMEAKALAAARQVVDKFVPAQQPKQATAVPAPPGGWDKITAAPTGHATAQTSSAFSRGNR